jgi:predicted HTH transcriptional regulator
MANRNEIVLYPHREGKNLELKENAGNLRKLVKTCIAFANGAGGEIVIGVEDETRRIKGIGDDARNRIYDDFPNCLYDSASPVLIPRIIERNISGAEVLVIVIYPGNKKPYFLKSDGYPKGVYVRVGSSTRRANTETIDDLIREQRRISYDEEPSGHGRHVLSEELVRRHYGIMPTERRLRDEMLLVTGPSSARDSLSVSNGAILFFNENPHKYIPESTVLCTRFAGTSGRNIVETTELQGPIPQLTESALTLTMSYLERDYVLRNHRLQGKHLVPREAVREALINALVHRKYTVPGPVKISRFDDKLEIFSPGGFPGLVSTANLGDGTTVLRNLLVARLARKMNLIEKLGTGIRLIFDSCEKAGLVRPDYSEDGDYVKITFHFKQNKSVAPVDKAHILKIVNKTGMLRPKDLLQTGQVSRRSLTRMLAQLTKEKKINRHGTGAGVYYSPVRKH